MTIFTLSDKKVREQKTDGYVFFMQEGFTFDTQMERLAKDYFPLLKTYFKENKFTGKAGQSLTVPGSYNKKITQLLFVGIGKKKSGSFELEDYRRTLASAIRKAECLKLASIAIELPGKSVYGAGPELIAQVTATVGLMTSYKFNEFVTNEDAKGFQVKELVICILSKDKKAVSEGIKVGEIIGKSVNRSRYWVDLPPNRLHPVDLSQKAKKLAKDHGLEITVFDEAKIEKLGMGGLKAVGMGSQHDAQMIIMQYTAKSKNAPTLALIGKGITFDSGGYNLKPTGYLETMKEDMTGAAAVINAIVAISQLKPNVNVVAVAAVAENMVSGNANHPGDIITFYNGKTAVVGNTDAEGRLVLADALAYASKHFKPTAMVDVATLTGAASHAVGPFFNCVLTQDDKLAEKIEKAGQTSGDATWRLPLIDRYKKMVESDIADICNDGKTKYYAGPTNGACFLSHFVGDTPWVHIDIAPTAFDVPDTPYYRPGGTGSGTRLLIDFVMQWK